MRFGGVLYFVFAAVPIYLTYAATLVDPAITTALLASDAQLVLPTFVKTHLPLYKGSRGLSIAYDNERPDPDPSI